MQWLAMLVGFILPIGAGCWGALAAGREHRRERDRTRRRVRGRPYQTRR